MTFITIRSLVSFIPFLVLLLISYEILARNLGNRQHRLTSALAFSIGLIYLSDCLLQIDDLARYSNMLVRAKYIVTFTVMSLAIYFFYMIGRPGSIARRWHAVALLPLTGAFCLAAFPQTFYIHLQSSVADQLERYSPAMNCLIALLALYSFFWFFYFLYGARKRALSRGLSNEYRRIRLIMYGCLGAFIYLLVSLVVGEALVRSGYPAFSYLPTYCVFIWVLSLRYAMLKYGFLANSNRQYELLFQLSDQGIILIDSEGRIVDANPAFRCMTGVEAGGSFLDVLTEGHRDSFLEDYREYYGRFAPFRRELELKGRGGIIRLVDLRCEHLEVNSSLLSFLLLRDITEQRKQERLLAQLASIDPLTGVYNRRQFLALLEQAISEAGEPTQARIALLFVDLDRFKEVNDTYGHDSGDELLRHASQLLQSHLPEDGVAGRLGGDEFALFFREKGEGATAEQVADRLIQAFQLPLLIRGTGHKISMSIGISRLGVDGSDAAELMNSADTAMYLAKRGGRNGYRVYGG